MRLGIKEKILGATALVVLISLTLCGIFAYYYFKRIFKEKAIADDLTRLDQIAQHLDYQINDIKNLSTSIIINPEIQEFIKKVQYPSQYERLKIAREKLDFLAGQISLREYIHSAAVMTIDGMVWYTDMRSSPHDYFTGKLAEKWYKKYESAEEQFYFSEPFTISNITRGKLWEQVISHIVQFRDINEPDRIIGRLFLNIYVDHFERQIRLNSADYDAFFWVNREGTIIYQRNDEGAESVNCAQILSDTAQVNQKTQLREVPTGYVIVNQLPSNGWKLISFTSNRRLFHRIRFIFFFFLFFTLISLLFIILIVLPIMLRITRPITELTEAMKKVAAGNLDVVLDIASGDELESMAQGFNQMVIDLKAYLAEKVKYEKNQRKMEFDILLSQINPHFIYNILNTVIYMARKQRNYDIVNLVYSFIRILQDGIKVGGEGLQTTVKQEIEIVNHYVQIQQYRYRDRFEVRWNVDESLLDCLIPKTLIQPLVENALFHGICPKEGAGVISITVFQENNDLVIMVEDDGVGMDEEMIDQLLNGGSIYEPGSRLRSIGITNIRDRIRYMYGDTYGLKIESIIKGGTKVKVTIPLNRNVS